MHPAGTGVWPEADPFGKRFDDFYHPTWASRAGSQLAGGWKGCFDGVQADQDFVHKVFKLQRFSLQHQCFPQFKFSAFHSL